MKAQATFFISLFFLLSMEGIHSQTALFGGSAVPLKPQSPLFGKDIIIYDTSGENQTKVVISSAFNGWLYAGYEYFSTRYNREAFAVIKSIDNGITWNVI